RGGLGVELDLGNDEALEVALVHVHLDRDVAFIDVVAALRDHGVAERAQRSEIVFGDLDLHLGAALARAVLHRQEGPASPSPHPKLPVPADRQIGLVDRLGGVVFKPIRQLGDQELSLELDHLPTWMPTRSGSPATKRVTGSGLRLSSSSRSFRTRAARTIVPPT